MTTLATKSMIAVAVLALAGEAVYSYHQALRTVGFAETAGTAVPAATKTAQDTPINACALLSDEEVSAAVGAKVAPAERRDDGEVGGKGEYAPPGTYSSTCFWRFANEAADLDDADLPMDGRRFAILNAMAWPKGGGYAAQFLKSFRDAFEHQIIPAAPIPLDGIGDEALWWGDGTAVRKGDTSFGVSVFLQNGDKASQRKMEEALARKVVGRI